MGRKRLITDEQIAIARARWKLARENSLKKIAADLGVNQNTLQHAMKRQIYGVPDVQNRERRDD